jgi:CubicO group peptidase (beta-lactamase class C family)
MYIVAGELVEAVSDTTWDDFLDARIFQPLGMTRTTTRSDVVHTRENVTNSHTRVDGEVTPLYRRNYDALGGAGSMFSSAHDMAQWIRLHLADGEFDGTQLLDSSTVAEMHEPQIVAGIDSDDRRLFPDRNFAAYGLGWRLHDYHGRKVVQHTGTVNYTRTQVGMIPSEGIGVVAISNLTTASLQTALMYHVFDALLGLPETDWSGEYLALAEASEEGGNASAQARIEGTKPSFDLEHFAGRYSDELYGDVEIEVEDGGLVLRYSPEYVADLEHWHHDTFRATWRPTGFGSTFATFSLDHTGEIDSLELRGFTTFERE